MLFADKLTFDHPRKTADGYMVVRARAARAGIYDYLGKEVDPKGNHGFAPNDTVKVYRPEEEVFAKDSVASFLMKPVTNDHPSQPVTAANWRDYAKGVVGSALRDGDYLAFDIVLMDKPTIADVESGKRELSNGYASELQFTPGQTDTGEHFDAIQKTIRGNHVAIVKKGRAGPMCRIGDAVPCDKLPAEDLIEILTDGGTYNDGSGDDKTAPARRETSNSGGSQVATKTITFDGLPLEVTDAAEAAITKLQNQAKSLQDKLTAAETQVATLTTDKATLETEKATLEQKVKDAALSPQQLRDAAKAYAQTVDAAKKLAPDLTIADDASEADIKKAVVSARLGDAAKDWSDDQVAVSFATLSNKVEDEKPDQLRTVIGSKPLNVSDGAAVRDTARAMQYN